MEEEKKEKKRAVRGFSGMVVGEKVCGYVSEVVEGRGVWLLVNSNARGFLKKKFYYYLKKKKFLFFSFLFFFFVLVWFVLFLKLF